jgi:subtilisin family serine protease
MSAIYDARMGSDTPVAGGGGPMPASSLRRGLSEDIAIRGAWPDAIDRDWAWGGSTGRGARVCLIDSGVDPGHPSVGPLSGSWAAEPSGDSIAVVEEPPQDPCGHGTAAAGIVRSLAPDCDLYSVRVLGAGNTGTGRALLAGLEWAIEQGFELVNMSLATTRREFVAELHLLADKAYFGGTLLVCSAHNMIMESYPWRFAAVVSVGSHEEPDPFTFFYNPRPPVEFYARGVDVEIPWAEKSVITATGNSFAAPHITGISALILGKHPELTPFQLKSVLYMTAANVGMAA